MRDAWQGHLIYSCPIVLVVRPVSAPINQINVHKLNMHGTKK